MIPNALCWIVTAVNAKFWLSSKTLLDSLKSVEGVDGILIFNLGLDEEIKQYLTKGSLLKCVISDELLGKVNDEYISHYKFKVDGLSMAPWVIKKTENNINHEKFYILWLDAGVLINQSLKNTLSFLQEKDFFLCDLATRKSAGMPGTAIKAFNHLPCYVDDGSDFPFSISVLTQPLSWAGIHGYRVGSKYNTLVVDAAKILSDSRPDMISGSKFVNEDLRIRMESDRVFKAALDFAMDQNISLASMRWNGARHDLFLYTCLLHQQGYTLISSEGLIEDITDGSRTKITASAIGAIEPELIFERSKLNDAGVEFVIHRGLFRIS